MDEKPLMPQDMDVEKAVLGELAMWPDEAGAVAIGNIDALDFYSEMHGKIARALLEGIEDGRPHDLVSLRSAFKDDPVAYDLVTVLGDHAPTGANVGRHVDILRELSLKRRIILVGEELAREGRNGKKAAEVLEDHRVRADDLQKSAAGGLLPTVAGPALEAMTFPGFCSLVGERVVDRGGFLSIVSEEGVGKTMLTMDLALRMATGKGGQWLGIEVKPIVTPVLFLFGEGGLASAKDRALKIGGSIPDTMHFLTPEQADFDLFQAHSLGRLKTTIERLKDRHGALSVAVFVDPQANWSSHDENKQGGEFYRRLNNFRLQTKSTLTVNHHTRKDMDGKGKGKARSARGDTRFPAIVDSALVLDKEENNSVRATWSKLRNSGHREPLIVTLNPTTFLFETKCRLSEKKNAKARLFEALETARVTGDGWLTRKQLQIEAGVHENTAQTYLNSGSKDGSIEASGSEGTLRLYRLKS